MNNDARHIMDRFPHTALVTCGICGKEILIALGLASAIACGKCKTEIVLGEDEEA